MSDTLTIPVKGIYFDQIAAGTKRLEYRLTTEYWTKRLKGCVYRNVVLTRGYPKSGGIEGETRLTRDWQGFVVQRITHEHFGAEPVMVFAIDVSRPATEIAMEALK